MNEWRLVRVGIWRVRRRCRPQTRTRVALRGRGWRRCRSSDRIRGDELAQYHFRGRGYVA